MIHLSATFKETDPALLWNVLGSLYLPNVIEYKIPKEYIWLRRKNLNGAKLTIGYLESPPYLEVVDPENHIITGNELPYGNKVNVWFSFNVSSYITSV